MSRRLVAMARRLPKARLVAAVAFLGGAVVAASACARGPAMCPCAVAAPTASAPPAPDEPDVMVETIYDGKPAGWEDWGWAPREVAGPGPARINFSNFGGWIVHKSDLKIEAFDRLVFRVKSLPEDDDVLAVHVLSGSWEGPEVRIEARYRTRAPGADAGWEAVEIPLAELDPGGVAFDRVIVRAAVPSKDGWTLLDKIGFAGARRRSAKTARPARPVRAERPIALSVRCDARATRISPLVYGIAYDFQSEADDHQWRMGATIRRWGGNPTSRYNWQIHAWNLDSDWFYENVAVPPYTKFLADDVDHSVLSALTVPMIGWVSKDTGSFGFPVAVYGPQARTDQWKPGAGNGETAEGKRLTGSPALTSIPVTADFVKKWVQAIRAEDAKTGRRSVAQYILDNEPALWNQTHRDVRPSPLSYDELVERTIAYGSAIRQADHDAVIAGPAEWGWMNYFYSAKDSLNDFAKADRKAHGDVPLVEYYLRKLREHDERTGTRALDVLDLHFYSEAQNGKKGMSEDERDALRIRSTRSLWDPDYVDESWIGDKIRLLPRMKEWIDKDYPGRGVSIGEWNFGGETRTSGGLATAEALGRFGQFGVTSAFYWTFPPAGSPAMEAFAAYRDFDGRGGRFLDWSLPTDVPAGELASLFASRDERGAHVVAVALNLSPDTPLAARIDVSSCGGVKSTRVYSLVEGASSITAADPVAAMPSPARSVDRVLPPYSITVLDLGVGGATGGLAN